MGFDRSKYFQRFNPNPRKSLMSKCFSQQHNQGQGEGEFATQALKCRSAGTSHCLAQRLPGVAARTGGDFFRSALGNDAPALVARLGA